MVNAKQMYSCGHCRTQHYTYQEAQECCDAEQIWACGKCEMNWEDNQENAEDCCSGDSGK